MSIIFSTPAILYYVFSVFLFSLQRHWRYFRGASIVFEFILGLVVVISSIASLVWLIMFGYYTHWYCPVIIFFASIFISGLLQGLISLFVPEWILSNIGFIAIPASLFFMFWLL